MVKKSLYVMLITVSACWIILATTQQTTQADPPPMAKPYPTFGCSASAGRMGCSSSATPGIGNHKAGQHGNGWTGIASARAGVGTGDATGPKDKEISAYIYNSYVEGGIVFTGPSSGSGGSGSSVGLGITIGRNFNEVDVDDASEERFGTPFQDKWASSSGCFGEKWDDDYDEWDGWRL